MPGIDRLCLLIRPRPWWRQLTGMCLLGVLLMLPNLQAQAADTESELPVLQVVAPDSLTMYGPLVAAVLRDAGVKPVLNFYPTARSRHLFTSGAADAEFFRIASLPADYPADVITIGPLQSVRFGLFVRADDALRRTQPADALWKQPLAYVRGTLALEALVKGKNLQNEAAPVERASGAKMLLAGRVNVLLDSERLLLSHLGETSTIGEIVLGATVLEEPTYLLLHGKAKAFEPAIKASVRQWLDSGRWQREFKAINVKNGLPAEMSLVQYPERR